MVVLNSRDVNGITRNGVRDPVGRADRMLGRQGSVGEPSFNFTPGAPRRILAAVLVCVLAWIDVASAAEPNACLPKLAQ